MRIRSVLVATAALAVVAAAPSMPSVEAADTVVTPAHYAQGGMGPGGVGMGIWGIPQGSAMSGMMAPMGPGMMMMGRGMMMGPGMMMGQRVLPQRDLSAEDVRNVFERQLAWLGNERLKVGTVEEKDDGTIVAEIVTAKEGALVDRLRFDRHSGLITRVN